MLKASRNSVIDLDTGKQLAVVVPSNATNKDVKRWAQYIVDRVNADERGKQLSQGKKEESK